MNEWSSQEPCSNSLTDMATFPRILRLLVNYFCRTFTRFLTLSLRDDYSTFPWLVLWSSEPMLYRKKRTADSGNIFATKVCRCFFFENFWRRNISPFPSNNSSSNILKNCTWLTGYFQTSENPGDSFHREVPAWHVLQMHIPATDLTNKCS